MQAAGSRVHSLPHHAPLALTESEKALPLVTPTGPSKEKRASFSCHLEDALICSIIKGGNDYITLSRPQRKSQGGLERDLLVPDETALKGTAAFRPLGFVVGMAHTKGRRHF